jgi:hypothetical protein
MLATLIIDLLVFCLGMMLTGWVLEFVRRGRIEAGPADKSGLCQLPRD